MDVGVIGVGTMGRNHARIYSELKGVDNVYLYDIDKERASLKEDVYICDSIEQLLSNVEAVSICVPTKYHFEVARKAIENGVHCLIEKPITLTIPEGEHLLRLCKDTDLVVGVGHIERFNPIIEEIKKIVKNPLLIGITRHNPGSARINDTTIVKDLMIHDIDILFNVLLPGEDYKLFSSGDSDLCVALFGFASSTAWISASRKAKRKVRKIYIEEESFTLEGDFMNQEIYVYRHPSEYALENDRYVQESVIEKVLVNKVEPLREELKTFITCVREGTEFPVTLLQGLNNLVKCNEILGRRIGKWIKASLEIGGA